MENDSILVLTNNTGLLELKRRLKGRGRHHEKA